jgi:hypothetical protein
MRTRKRTVESFGPRRGQLGKGGKKKQRKKKKIPSNLGGRQCVRRRSHKADRSAHVTQNQVAEACTKRNFEKKKEKKNSKNLNY